MSNTQNKYNSTSSSASLNYRKGKFGLNANLTGSQEIEPQEYIIRNGNKHTVTESVGPIDSPEKNLGGYINMDYQLTEKSNLALSWNTWANNSKGATIFLNDTYSNYDDNGNLINRFYNLSRNVLNSRSYNNNLNLNYELKTDEEGSKLNLNAAYLTYKRIQDSDNRTYASDANWNQAALANQIIQDTPQNINNISAMADYIKKFKNDFSVSIGGNYNKTKTENNTKYESTNFATNEATKYKPNLFEYDENIYSLYLTLEKKFSDKFSGKIGTRYEITNSIGTSDNPPAERPDMARVEKNYNNILPYLSLNYAINDKHNISYALSSRMRRPSFWELNPVRNIITQDNYTQNNPFVKASSIYNQELTYMFKNSYFLILNHSYFKDVITMVPLQRDVVRDGNTYRQLAYIRSNYGDKQEMSAMLGMQKSFFNHYLTTNFNIVFQHNINDGTLNTDPTTAEIFDTYTNTKKSTSLLIQTNNTIRLDKEKTWFVGVNFFYVDKQQIDFGQLQSLAVLDLSIKKLWNNWTFAVNVNDVLKTNIVKIKDEQADGNFNYLSNDFFRRGLTASVTYNFGNQKVQKARKVDGAADDIKSRTR
ncbi:outer membrane beta-barrel family protein [Chryseobacterium sp. TY3]